MWIIVSPWLVAFAVLEIPVDTADGHIKYNIELLVERSAIFLLVLPRVVEEALELALGEQVLVEVEPHHFSVVDLGDDSLFSPIELIRVEIISQTARVLVGSVSSLPCVIRESGSVVESRGELM